MIINFLYISFMSYIFRGVAIILNKRPSGPRAHLRYEIRGPAMCLGHLEGGTVGIHHEQYLPPPPTTVTPLMGQMG